MSSIDPNVTIFDSALGLIGLRSQLQLQQNNSPPTAMIESSLSNESAAVAGITQANCSASSSIASRKSPFYFDIKTFPETLFHVVSCQDHAQIISWLPDGQSFIIHDKQRFASEILPSYFGGAKFASFGKRLSRWKFNRVPKGPDMGAYYNENFKRDHPELIKKIAHQVGRQFKSGEQKSKRIKNGEKEQIDVQTEMKLPSEKQIGSHDGQKPFARIDISSTKNSTQVATTQVALASPNLMSHKKKPSEQAQVFHEYMGMSPNKSKAPKKEPPTVHMPLQSVRHLTATDPSMLPRVSYKLVTPDFNQHQSMEAHRELLLTSSIKGLSSMMASEAATGWPVAHLGLESNISRFMAITQAPQAQDSAQTLHYIERAERIERILDTERSLGLLGCPSASSISNQGLVTPNIQPREVVDPTAPVFQTSLAPSSAELLMQPVSTKSGWSASASLHHEQQMMALPYGYSHLSKIPPRQDVVNDLVEPNVVSSCTGAGRAIMMSQQEEEEFAMYLLWKRKGGVAP